MPGVLFSTYHDHAFKAPTTGFMFASGRSFGVSAGGYLIKKYSLAALYASVGREVQRGYGADVGVNWRCRQVRILSGDAAPDSLDGQEQGRFSRAPPPPSTALPLQVNIVYRQNTKYAALKSTTQPILSQRTSKCYREFSYSIKKEKTSSSAHSGTIVGHD